MTSTWGYTGTSIKVDVNIASYLVSNLCVNFYGSHSTRSGILYFTRSISIPSEVARHGACVPVHLVNELVEMEADLPQ